MRRTVTWLPRLRIEIIRMKGGSVILDDGLSASNSFPLIDACHGTNLWCPADRACWQGCFQGIHCRHTCSNYLFAVKKKKQQKQIVWTCFVLLLFVSLRFLANFQRIEQRVKLAFKGHHLLKHIFPIIQHLDSHPA